MSRLRAVAVDPERRLAHVGPGCLLGDVDRATQEHGLATPLGFISEVGVAGLTLGGGLGYLTRRFGWTVDNLVEVEIVTADGADPHAPAATRTPTCSGRSAAAARNLGVVTRFTFRLHDGRPDRLRRADRLAVRAGRRDPARLPDDHHRGAARAGRVADPPPRPAGAVRARGVARQADLRHGRLLQRRPRATPTRRSRRSARSATRSSTCSREQPYTEVQSYLDATEPKGHHYYWRTEYLAELSDELLADLRATLAASARSRDAELGLLHLGGALNERDGRRRRRRQPRRPLRPRRERHVGARRAAARPRSGSGSATRGRGSGRSRPAAPTSTSRPPTRATTASAPPTAPTSTAWCEVKRALRPGQPVPRQPQHPP